MAVLCANCDDKGFVAIPWREYDPRRFAKCAICNGRAARERAIAKAVRIVESDTTGFVSHARLSDGEA